MAENDNGSLAPPPEDSGSSGRSISLIIKLSAAILILLILALLAFALVAALTAAETWAPFVQIFRDVLIIIIVVESVLIVTAFAILILQAAGFIIMLKTEIKPILDNARETTRLTKATAEFVSQNSIDPLIQIKSFISGLLGFLREIIRIRALLQTDPAEGQDDEVS
ncbi:MAG: hypothetical protein OXN94_14405 [Chloroflexota bacterium]|nr:hypothetical protein [Chloroflexota bacterium]MDE2859032.1 hypothetical protein [Chloroflexota bacterium]MDE2952267.1 hypothetical protein [Chloroflexota bacterium]